MVSLSLLSFAVLNVLTLAESVFGEFFIVSSEFEMLCLDILEVSCPKPYGLPDKYATDYYPAFVIVDDFNNDKNRI